MSGFRVWDVERNYGPNGKRIGQFTDKSIHWKLQNPILPIGVLGLESDTGRIKWGDGKNTWNKLPYRTQVLKDVCQIERSGKDENGIFTVVTRKRANGTKFRTNTLSHGTSPEYARRTVRYYDEDGETLVASIKYDLFYEDGELIREDLFPEEDIVTNGLTLNLDAADLASYPRTGDMWYDLTNDNNMVLMGDPLYLASNSGAIRFTGSQYAVKDSHILIPNGGVSIEAWFNLDEVLSQDRSILNHSEFGYLNIIVDNENKLRVEYPGMQLFSNSTVENGTWNHFVAVISNVGGAEIYLNGKLDNSNNDPSSLDEPIESNLYIGYNSSEYYPNMKISVIREYNRPLTQQEIIQNYDALSGRYISPTGPIITNGLAVHLDAGIAESYPGTGDIWYDLTGNDRNGVIVDAIFDTEKQGSFQFGEDTYATVQLMDWSFTGDFSYNIWAKVGSSGSGWQTIIDFPDDQFFLGIYYNELRGYTSYEDNSLLRTGYYLIEDTWYNICMTYEASGTFKFYVNSLLVHLVEIVPNMEPGDNYLSIGSGGGGDNEFWTGKISKILFYNRALTQSEVNQNFNAMKARYGLVAET